MGKSRGGLTAKLLAAVDHHGVMVTFLLVPGTAAQSPQLPGLPADINVTGVGELIGDKACDTNDTLALLRAREIAAVIPSRANRKAPRRCDSARHGMRHLVATRFAALKEFRRVATRYCQRALMYGGCSTWCRLLWPCARRCPGIRPAAVRQCKAIFSMVSTGPGHHGQVKVCRQQKGADNRVPGVSWTAHVLPFAVMG